MSDESKGAVTVYETTPVIGAYRRYRIEVSGQPEHLIPRQMVSKADYDALAARLAAAEARVTEVEGERDAARGEEVRLRGMLACKTDGQTVRVELPTPENGGILTVTAPSRVTEERIGEMLVSLFKAMGAIGKSTAESDRDRLAAANAELQAEIDRINDAQAASLGAEIVRLTEANAAQAREIERLREDLAGAPDALHGVRRDSPDDEPQIIWTLPSGRGDGLPIVVTEEAWAGGYSLDVQYFGSRSLGDRLEAAEADRARLAAEHVAQAREIERLRTLLGRAKDELNSGPLEDRDALHELVTNAEPSWDEDAWAWKFRTDELCREIGAALAPAADASGEVTGEEVGREILDGLKAVRDKLERGEPLDERTVTP